MDDLEPEYTLAAAFPLPFRALLLIGVGILGWATNIHGLDLLGVDVAAAMELRTPHSQPASLAFRPGGFRTTRDAHLVYSATYKLFGVYASLWLASWLVFRSATWKEPFQVDVFGYIPAVSALCMVVVLICPFDIFQKFERDKFLLALRRCLFPRVDSPVYFADVVFADICTSFAKVLGDLWLSLCMLYPGNSLLIPPSLSGLSRWVLPMIMSLPYAIRLRQCVIEYSAASNESRRPLYNAVKYASTFPVMFLSAAQRIVVLDADIPQDAKRSGSHLEGGSALFRWWLLAAAVNSLYSYWWDVTNDWGLDMFRIGHRDGRLDKPSPRSKRTIPLLTSPNGDSPTSGPSLVSNREHMPYPWGLRPQLLYPLPTYPLVIFLNLVLRLTWSLKLSSHLHLQTDGGVGFFWLEIAEIIRRWVWVFIRVEWEVVKQSDDGSKRDPFTQLEYELITTSDEAT